MSSTEPKRESLLLPILIPVGILIGIAIFAVGMGTMLLAMSAEAAALTALSVMIGIVTVSTLVARAKKGGSGGLVVQAATFFGVALMVGGISLATFGQPKVEEPEKPAVKLSQTAKDLAFGQAALSAPADTPIELSFDNQDSGIPHDIQIYSGEDASGGPMFSGEVISGPASTVYKVPGLAEGVHLFDCKIHPTMTGKLTIGGTAPSGDGSETAAAPGSTVAQVAHNFAFESAKLDGTADAPIAITFDNQDAATPHDIRIYNGPTVDDGVHFEGEVITGPAKTTYSVDPLAAGEYLFDCKIHPNMTGTLVVSAAGAGSDEPTKSGGDGKTPEVAPGGALVTSPPPPPSPVAAKPAALQVAAKDLAFDTEELQVPADQAFTIDFDNQDSGIPHTIEIFSGESASDPLLFDGAIVTGPAKMTYDVDALPAGTYLFNCKVHPTMEGTITAS